MIRQNRCWFLPSVVDQGPTGDESGGVRSLRHPSQFGELVVRVDGPDEGGPLVDALNTYPDRQRPPLFGPVEVIGIVTMWPVEYLVDDRLKKS